MLPSKDLILKHALQEVDLKIKHLQKILSDLSESANNESKSSAGDKHETTRAHLQIEQEKIGKQLFEWENQKQIIERINPTLTSEKVTLGSLLETENELFYVSLNLGKHLINSTEVIFVSYNSPITSQFINCPIGQSFLLNGFSYLLKSVH